MSYTLNYSDPAKNINPIIVADGTKNTQSTSLTLIGRNYPGYGQAIGEDLLHLLENFASPTPPNNPIEGQLWFDTSDPNNKKLRINDGGVSASRWSPINGIFQQSTEPTTVKVGDIWVNTAQTQVYIYNGSDFVLVGPATTGTSRTGSYPEEVTDTLGNPHNVIINYVNDQPIEIISTEDFTPNPVIEGFGTIEAGVNVSTADLGTPQQSNIPKINGIAESAYYLQLSVPSPQKVIADSFMRKDTDQRMTGTLSLAVDGNALRIGSDPTFILERRDQYNARFVNTFINGRFTFDIAGSSEPIVVFQGDTRQVTINHPETETADSGLTVYGSVKASKFETNVNGTFVEGSLVPIGTIMPYAGNTAPSGWLICDGADLGTNPTYQTLRDLIGKKYDPTDTNFLLPNLTNALASGLVAINYIIKY